MPLVLCRMKLGRSDGELQLVVEVPVQQPQPVPGAIHVLPPPTAHYLRHCR